MFYLDFTNQLQLIILLLFSSYILMSALTIKLTDIALKAFGLSFFIPLSLGVFSFLAAPHNIGMAIFTIDFAWLLLIFMLSLVSLFNNPPESAKILYPLAFLLPLAAIALSGLIMGINYTPYARSVLIAVMIIQLLFMVFYILSKNGMRVYMHTGVFLLTGGYLLIGLIGDNLLPGVLISVLGFSLCAFYFYRNSYGVLKREHKRNTEALNRINNNVHLEVVRRVEEIERTNRKLVEKSKTDSMTGLYVKSAILNKLESMVERSPNAQISLIMFDIDRFKNINDTQGHQVGDKCIKTLATLARCSFRQDDILGRYGGDEFMVILPGAPPVRAYLIADRFRQAVQNKTNPPFTISCGIATFPNDAKSAAELIAAADKALYVSKQSGRNRVTNYSALPTV
jgi:diguanylate cyclase (GGDEF)-like protein